MVSTVIQTYKNMQQKGEGSHRKLRGAIVEALFAYFGKVAISTNQKFGVHRWLVSVKVQHDTMFVCIIMCELQHAHNRHCDALISK